MKNIVRLMGLLLFVVVSCDDEIDDQEEAYPVGATLRLSASAPSACVAGDICVEWCEVYSDGTDVATGLTCCVDSKLAEQLNDPETFGQCLANIRTN